MGGIDHQVISFPDDLFFHLLLGQPSGTDRKIFPLQNQSLSVFSRHADGDLHIAGAEIFSKLPPLGRTGKQEQFIHFYILLVSPVCR